MNTTPQTLIAHLRNAETNNVGFSYNINNGDSNPDHGYMVSRAGHEEIVPQGADLVAYGKHYFLRHAETLAEDNAYMGCWFDGSNFVFDISENVQTKEVAIELGSANNQLAIWDCASGSEYRLMREGDEPVQLVTIYYNDVFVSEVPNEIYANCPYVNVPINEAIEYADNKIENREWDSYCIPELCNHEVKFTEVLYQRDNFDAMLDTLGVAMDEFIQLHNHARIDGMDTYYENHIIQLNQIISFVTESKLNQQ
jgi:hypothetical protein